MVVLGVDVGGTFTDTALITDRDELVLAKAPTNTETPAAGVIESVTKAANKADQDLSEILERTESFFHGTTIATNTILERSGAEVGLLTTKGHEDAQRIGRITTRHAGLSVNELKQYVEHEKGAPFAARERTCGIEERIDKDGNIVVELSDADVRTGVRELLERDVDAIAINFLWSFRNPTHERRAAELVEAEFDLPVFRSSSIAPRLGEYERGATTSVAAYVAADLAAYLTDLENRLRDGGLSAPLLVMQNNGGVVPASKIVQNGASVLVSGPAAGVTGAAEANFDAISRTTDEEGRQIICTDVGGTSFDVGLVVDGAPELRPTLTFDKQTFYQQAVNIESIGNGGGSIAWLGSENGLHIGPESAGADPGPICYGQGGTDPTVTDADLVLGYLDPNYFLGGDMQLEVAPAAEAIEDQIGTPLGLDTRDAARGIYDLMNAQMADLIRKMTIENGYDPREFTVFAYGGAGPVHATGYGRELGVDSVTVPLRNIASVFSAYGLTAADIQQVEEISEPMEEPFDISTLTSVFDQLRSSVKDALEFDLGSEIEYTATVDMRYAGQLSELTITLPTTDSFEDLNLADLFEREYVKRYGESAKHPSANVEIITQRLVGRIPIDVTEVATVEAAEAGPTPSKHRDVVWRDGVRNTPIYFAEELQFGHHVSGPAVVQLPSTTIPVPPNSTAEVGENGSIVVNLGGEQS